MQIDWLTVAAQAVNFLVLVFLLKKFLYGPVVAAIERREARIAGRLSEAAEREAAAGRTARDYEDRLRGFEREREALAAQARDDAAAERERLMQAAREDIARTESAWREELARERQAIRQALRQEIAVSAQAIARRCLADVADAGLESRAIGVFLGKLAALDGERRAAFADGAGPVTVATGFPLAAADRQRVLEALRELVGGDVDTVFETDPALVCGIEIDRAGRRIGWSVADQLDEVEDALLRRLAEAGDAEARPPVAGGAARGAAA